MGSFKDLVVWQKAREYRNVCAKLAREKFPKEEQYRLTDQLIRSTRPVTAQIAEDHGRFHYKEYIQCCRMARGELSESRDHLSVALDEGYIDQTEHDKIEEQAIEIERLLNGYIKHLKDKLGGN